MYEDVDLDALRESLIEEYGEVYEFKVDKYHFFFRPLTIRELSLANMPGVDIAALEDHYVQEATLFPPNFNFDSIKAGFVTQYADEVLRISGFDDLGVINEMLETHRARAHNDIIHTMKSYIITAMPAYKEEDLMDLPMIEFTRKVVLAEEIITIQQGLSGIETTGFKLVIKPVGAVEEEEEEPQEIRRDPRRDKPRKRAEVPMREQARMSEEEREKMKRKYIAQIRDQNRESINVHEMRGPLDDSGLEEMDPEMLERMLGVARADDPIARKLMGG